MRLGNSDCSIALACIDLWELTGCTPTSQLCTGVALSSHRVVVCRCHNDAEKARPRRADHSNSKDSDLPRARAGNALAPVVFGGQVNLTFFSCLCRFSCGLGMHMVAKSDLSTGNSTFASYVLQSHDMVRLSAFSS